jgi:predicted membrane metal-binding protein
MGHENLDRDEHVEGSSDRSFGFVFAAVFALIALWPLMSRAGIRWWPAILAVLFLLLALFLPAVLAPLNTVWTRLGVLLGKIVSPIALGVVFFLVITPLGLLMRLAGKDPLRLKFARTDASYWIRREPPGPKPDSLTNQF